MKPSHLGRYEVVGEAGQGAMGTVYRARDPLIERNVAIKTVACTGLSPQEVEGFERRFFREAKSAGRLNHPNIVTVYDVGRSGDLAYMAMEWLDGQSLREVLDSGAVLPVRRVADIAAQVADGLAFAHAQGIVHRDVKPANIMVLANGTVKIADFGAALLPTGPNTVAGMVFGSPKYMSPEQVTGQAVDGRSDIFALGAVIYEMLTGLPPFNGGDLAAILYQVLHAEPEPPSSRRRNLPHEMDRIVARAMAKAAADRYRDAAEMAADLRRCCGLPAGAPAPVHPPPAAAPRAPHATDGGSVFRRGRPALLAGIITAMVLVVTSWLLGWPDTEPDKPAATAETSRATKSVPAPATVPRREPSVAPRPAAPVPRVAESEASASRTPAPRATGRLKLAIAPWGEVYVDGHRSGISPPLREILLAPGRHVVEIRNGSFPRHRETIDLAANGSVRVKHKFQ